MSILPFVSQLLVEGKNDQHVVWALCERHRIAETFTVELPDDEEGGIDGLIASIPVRLKISRLRALGIIIDADQNLQGHWDSVCRHLTQAGYQNLPPQPEIDGFITTPADKPRVGVWLMPNNQLPGMLENFVAHLIPDDDPLASKAEAILQEIERDDLNRYAILHHPKAYIHTWLAWQEMPGRPMGQAIMAHVLMHDSPLAITFVTWLNRLFVSP